MHLNLFSTLLLNGFVPVVLSVQSVASTLYLIKQVKSWPDARSFCRATYTDLAPVKTYDDLLRIRTEAARQSVTTWALWIGLYNDLNNWRWSFHDLSISKYLQNWQPGEPNNGFGSEQCGFLKPTGVWNDMSCSTLYPFICYNAQYPGNSRFVGVTTPMNWTDAQTYCRSFHTDLATALVAADNSLLAVIASVQGDSWFGLYRDGWTWTNHTKALNIAWKPGQPDNYYGNEICGMTAAGLIEDVACAAGHYFFCHDTPLIKRKMLKLQVKSDQNVFDAAVQSSLLMKIMQKLEEHGMLQNITVTWRVQPDGNVFYKKNNAL